MRWGVETGISIQKNLLQLESFSGLSVESVCQDFYATVFMANLASLLARQASEEQKAKSLRQPSAGATGLSKRRVPKWSYQVNMNKATGRLREKVVDLFASGEPESILQDLSDYFKKHLLPIRRGRCYTRYRKNKQSFSKHKTFSNYKPAV